MALLAWLSLRDNSNSSSWLHDMIPGADKVMHLGAYTVTTFLGSLVFAGRAKDGLILWLIALGCFFWSVILEVLQLLMDMGRHFEVLDLIANIIGCFAGVAAYRIFKQRDYGSK